jgi:hypothetical protein
MNSEQFKRRDLLKMGMAAAGGLAVGIGGTKTLDRFKRDEDGDSATQQDEGTVETIAYVPVTTLTYFEKNNDIQGLLTDNAKNIRLDVESGVIDIIDDNDHVIAQLPGRKEIAALYVSGDRCSLRFEYHGKDGSDFGVRVGRSLSSGDLTLTQWDTAVTPGVSRN